MAIIFDVTLFPQIHQVPEPLISRYVGLAGMYSIYRSVSSKRKYHLIYFSLFSIIHVYVGPERKKFAVRKSKLCKVPEFDSRLEENPENKMELPWLSSNSFRILLHWLDNGSLPPLHNTVAMQSMAGTWNWDAYDAYYLANRLALGHFADRIMDTLRAAEARADVYPDLDTARITFQNCWTNSGAAMRRYLVDCLHRIIVEYNDGGAPAIPWEDLSKGFTEGDELRLAVEKQIWGQRGRRVPEPRTAPNCFYHQHYPGLKCPNKEGIK
jgi:hypothetical protein